MRRRSRDTDNAALAGAASAAVAEVEASLVVPPDPSAAAFFDVDNTMMQGASIYHFARGLAA
ncbi:MAG TPA: HAD-IB family hydrolase, partial [Nocardioidaceae bacterium]|nr:HAD-IB family hydrolase [Nocardioidaceae bacterium]